MQNVNINFKNIDHACKMHREGDWEIWECPQCPGYAKKFNHKLGIMETNETDYSKQFVHGGMSYEKEIQEILSRYVEGPETKQ